MEVISLREGLPKVLQHCLYFGQQAPELNLFRLKKELHFAFHPPKLVTCFWVFQLQREPLHSEFWGWRSRCQCFMLLYTVYTDLGLLPPF